MNKKYLTSYLSFFTFTFAFLSLCGLGQYGWGQESGTVDRSTEDQAQLLDVNANENENEGGAKLENSEGPLLLLKADLNLLNQMKVALNIPAHIKLSLENFPFLHKAERETFNFGVLVNNPEITIYRSAGLGKSGLQALFGHLEKNHLPAPEAVIYMNKDGYKNATGAKNLFTRFMKNSGEKYKEFALEEDQWLTSKKIFFYHPLAVDELEANTYLDGINPLQCHLKNERIEALGDAEGVEGVEGVEAEGACDGDEESGKNILSLLGRRALQYYEKNLEVIQSRKLKGDQETLYNILDLILLRSHRAVLFHCKGGVHRTGMIALAIRSLQGGLWTAPFQKPVHVKVHVKHIFPRLVEITNLAELEYFFHNPKNFRESNLLAIRELSGQGRFQMLQEKFQKKIQ
jgi:hypothetical protein